MSPRQKELEKVLAKEQFSLDSLESRVLDRMEAVEAMADRVVSQKETVDKARKELDLWVNAPTKTKQQVMSLAKSMGVEVSDNGLYEGWYNIEITAPYGSQFSENECQYMEHSYHESECTKNMLWHIVHDYMLGGLEEREEEDEEVA